MGNCEPVNICVPLADDHHCFITMYLLGPLDENKDRRDKMAAVSSSEEFPCSHS